MKLRSIDFVTFLFFATKLQKSSDFAPFQSDDYELCLRAWSEGLQVGWYDAGFTSLSAGGMRLYNNAFTREMTERNAPLLYDLYIHRTDDIRRKVSELNAGL